MLVRPGRHLWIWARTDRDAPTTRDVQDTTAAMMARVLGTTINGVSLELLPESVRRYSIGAARPLDVALLPRRPAAPPAAVAERFEDQEQPFAVKATRPIFVAVDFDWRGPNLEIEDWPRRKVNFFGLPVDDEPMELDWLLLDAYQLGTETREDVTAGDLLRGQLPSPGQLGSVLVFAVLAWLAFRS